MRTCRTRLTPITCSLRPSAVTVPPCDFLSIKSLNKLIEQLKNEGKTIIILSHELEKCLALADKMIVLHKGKIVFDGTAKEGLLQDLEQWNLKNPICNYSKIEDLIW